MSDAEEIDVSAYGNRLATLVIESFPDWATRSILTIAPGASEEDALAVSSAVAATLAPQLIHLLSTDIDEQRQSPLALVRRHMHPLTAHLAELRAAPAIRDPYDVEAFPADVFALGPKAWSDLGDDVSDAGLRWGAAKAMAHRRRHSS